MTRSELYDFIANATQDQYTTDMIITAVDAYSSASNGAKPNVSGSLPLDELDSAAERYLIPNYFTNVPTIEEEIKEFNELKEAFKAGYLLRQ